MSAGCKKADRNRKSQAMARYNAGKRDLVNAKRKQAKNKKRITAKLERITKVPRGMARALRRWKCGDTKPSNPSSLMPEKEWKRIKQSKVQLRWLQAFKEQPMVLLNGLPMTPQQAAVVARRIEAERNA